MNSLFCPRPMRAGVIALGCFLVCGVVSAFPPAPHHVLYGQVRNQWGDPIAIFPSDVFLETPSGIQLHTTVTGPLEPGVNYRLEVPMDSGTAPDVYQPTALRPAFPYRLKVLVGNSIYLPFEMSGDFSQIGRPAEKTRLNLTLGVDSDRDGLPDAWEEAVIAAVGGTLASINPNGDADGDGISNLDEYLAGTYAFDPTDGFALTIQGVTAGRSSLELLVLRGRNYSIQASPDFRNWTTVSFRLTTDAAQAPLRNTYQSTDVRTLRLEVPSQAGTTNRFFRALVQ